MMPDLNTESPRVVKILHTWIKDVVQTFNIDILRVDTVKHIRKDFWPDFVAAGGVVAIGEVLHGGEYSFAVEDIRTLMGTQ
jgi:alpha-amylase